MGRDNSSRQKKLFTSRPFTQRKLISGKPPPVNESEIAQLRGRSCSPSPLGRGPSSPDADVFSRLPRADPRPALLLLGNCSSHAREWFTALCRQRCVIAVCLFWHSSHILQTLDLSLFAIYLPPSEAVNRMEALNAKLSRTAGVVEVIQ
jgi:hypothetical protein